VVKIEVDLRAHRDKPSRKIKDLIRDVGARTFERNGEMVTIAVCDTYSGTGNPLDAD
jgi:hypothetical protein